MAIQTYTKGDPRQAASLVQVAIDSVHHDAVTAYDGTLSPRDHAIFLARSADAHLALGDLDAACADATAAVDRLHGVDSDRSTTTVADIRRKLARHHNSLAVRDFLTRTA